MSRPIARPIASRTPVDTPSAGGDSRAVRAANDSLLGRPLRISATRLEYIGSQLTERIARY